MVHGPSSGDRRGLCSSPALPFGSSATLGESLTLSECDFAHLCENVCFYCSNKLTLKQRVVFSSEIYYYSSGTGGQGDPAPRRRSGARSHVGHCRREGAARGGSTSSSRLCPGTSAPF